ncbi:hypothetical protein ACFYKT_12295 [Cytobacillus sp. FJAT-53684]|uniref:Group II intron reverse transcriptase/maturase n=1 Tax=Cytobacillus mangrovibacter TaxID=3299024 RepID=A0ABW6K1B5_9BACI
MYERKLIDKILDKDNLDQAFKQVKKNKGSVGVDGMTVDELAGYLVLNQDYILLDMRMTVLSWLKVRCQRNES